MDYAGNPNKNREPIPEKKIEKVVTGEVVSKPKPIGRKFKDIFFGGDLKTATKFVAADVILPALRDVLVDAITNGARRVIYGESMQRRNRPYEYRPIVQYNNPYNSIPTRSYAYPRDPRDPRPRANLPDQPNSWRSTRPNSNEIFLANKSDAENVVERLIDIIDKYDSASVADLYELIGQSTSHVDYKWGWTYLHNVEIRQTRDGFLIDLPPAEAI